MKTLGWVVLILGGALVIALVWARSQGKSLGDLFHGVTGQREPAPPWTPDTAMYTQDTGKAGFVEACGQVVQVGGGLALAAGDPTTKAIGAVAVVTAPYACKGVKEIGKGLSNVGSGIKMGAKSVWGWLT